MCTHNICFEQKYENSKKKSTKNCHFYGREKSLHGRVFVMTKLCCLTMYELKRVNDLF